MTKPTVVFIHHFSDLGGAEQFLVSLWGKRDDVYDAVLLNQGDGDFAQAAQAVGVKHAAFSLPGCRKLNAWIALRLAQRKVIALCRKLHADVICSGCYRVTPYAVAAAGACRIPSITILQDYADPAKLKKFSVFESDRLVTVSQGPADRLRSVYSGPIEVIPNGIDFDHLPLPDSSRQRLRAEWGIPAEALVVGVIAHILPWKGHDVFLEAMAQVHAQQKDVFFVIVGESLYQHELDIETLKRKARELGIDHQVIFTGGRKDIFQILRAFDVLVHPSQREAFGRVIIEAMAMEVPVIATACGGPQEIIDHEVSGILVDVGDSQAIARETVRLLGDAGLRERLARTGRGTVYKNFNSQTVFQRFNQIILDMTGR